MIIMNVANNENNNWTLKRPFPESTVITREHKEITYANT